MSRRLDAAVSRFDSWAALYACPVCGQSMLVDHGPHPSFVCDAGHRFDFAKQGYLNLLLCTDSRATEPGYTTQMLTARRRALQGGIFSPLVHEVVRLLCPVLPECGVPEERPTLLDVGTGEGTLLQDVLSGLSSEGEAVPAAIGTDISKAGMRMACGLECDAMWCVSNAKRLPLKRASLSIVLNILAPDAFDDFALLLQEGGHLVKVVPRSNHLIEIRHAIYEKPRSRPLGFASVRDQFEASFAPISSAHCTYMHPVTDASLPDLLGMSPLFWKGKRDKMDSLLEQGLQSVTCDFDVVLGRAHPA